MTATDDLPVIRENVRQGFLQTQSTVNRWINDFRKRIDGEADSDDHDIYAPPGGAPPQRQNYGASQADQLRGIRKNAETAARQNRLSTESNRYDADPRVLSDNFAELELRDEGKHFQPQQSSTLCLETYVRKQRHRLPNPIDPFQTPRFTDQATPSLACLSTHHNQAR